jgi:hypothetical protein
MVIAFYSRCISAFKEAIMAEKQNTGKRELIDTGSDKRYVKRDEKGQVKESDDVGKSHSQDVRHHAKTKEKPGYGDRGDQ